MAKNVFQARDIVQLTTKIKLKAPYEEEAEEVDVEAIEDYSGPTSDDLRREAELFRQNWETEKAAMIEEAKAEADRIIKAAEEKAFSEVKRKTDEVATIRQSAEDEAKQILETARRQSAVEIENAQADVEKIRTDAHDEGFEAGRKEGFAEGRAEVDRLIDHLHMIINAAIEKRNDIIEESETQIINLVLLIATKVIKVISENQKNVVINNVIQALRKLKSRGEVIIKVNLTDLELTTEHVKDFMRMVENVRSITVLEDSTVDKGGCILETDFGQIDARISSQLKEIEEKIMQLTPIRAKGEE